MQQVGVAIQVVSGLVSQAYDRWFHELILLSEP